MHKECSLCLNNTKMNEITLENGVCNVCLSYSLIKDNLERYDLFEMAWKNTLNKYHIGMGIKYDGVMGLSGGKDSTYVIYQLVHCYKLKIKAVTFDNGFLSDTAKKNIESTVKLLKIDHEYITFDREFLKNSYRVSMDLTGSICLGCSFIMYAAIHDYAIKNSIPMIFHGRSRQQMLSKAFQNLEKPFSNIYTVDNVYREKVNEIFPDFAKGDICPYIGYFMYHRYDEGEIKKVLQKELNWNDVEKDGKSVSHFDCRVHSAASYLFKLKNGYEIDRMEMSYMVRSGLLSKDEAQKLLNKSNELELSMDSFTEIALILGISVKELLKEQCDCL